MLNNEVTIPILFVLPLLSTYVLLITALAILLARENALGIFRQLWQRQHGKLQQNSNREKFPTDKGRFFLSNGQSSNDTVATCCVSPDNTQRTVSDS